MYKRTGISSTKGPLPLPSESTVKRHVAMMKVEHVWCTAEHERIGGQIEQVRDEFATVEHAKTLWDRIDRRLETAVLEALETEVTVPVEGDVRLQFVFPMPSASTVSNVPRTRQHKTPPVWRLDGQRGVRG